MKRLTRSRRDRLLAGVCGGIGEYFNLDSNLIRVLAVIIGIVLGIVPALIAYLVAWIIIPEETFPES